MHALGRTARQVALGMAAVVGFAAVRSLLSWRRHQQGQPIRLSRRARKRRRARARTAARWAVANVETLRRFIDTSEAASAQLSTWDNARRTGDSFLSAAEVVQQRLSTEASGPWSSSRAALQRKLAEVRADAAPHLHASATAEAELGRLQASLGAQERRLHGAAPADIAAGTKALVAAHNRARQPMSDSFEELVARRRLDELAGLREELEAMLASVTTAGS